MPRTPWGFVLCVLALGTALAGCDGPSRGSNTQPSGLSGFGLQVTASPNVVRGAPPGSAANTDGGCSVIQAVVTKNNVLVDGALVTVTKTLGVFKGVDDEFAAMTGSTSRGVATFIWCAKSERGTSIITVTVEESTATVLITIS